MQVYEWPKRFREDHANVSDDPWCMQPSTMTNEENIKQLGYVVWNDQWKSIQDILGEVGMPGVFLFLQLKCSERMVCKPQRSHYKSNNRTDGSMKKMVSRNASKSVSLSKGDTLQEMFCKNM
jgi:hypothetical protein